jgi:hypothetical protein
VLLSSLLYPCSGAALVFLALTLNPAETGQLVEIRAS